MALLLLVAMTVCTSDGDPTPSPGSTSIDNGSGSQVARGVSAIAAERGLTEANRDRARMTHLHLQRQRQHEPQHQQKNLLVHQMPNFGVGEKTFATCASCHGADATGITGLGKNLVESKFIKNSSDAYLATRIKVGRSRSDPENKTGIDMRHKGGNPADDDPNGEGLVAYIRSLQYIWS